MAGSDCRERRKIRIRPIYIHRHASNGLQIAQLLGHGRGTRLIIDIVDREMLLRCVSVRLLPVERWWRWLSIVILRSNAARSARVVRLPCTLARTYDYPLVTLSCSQWHPWRTRAVGIEVAPIALSRRIVFFIGRPDEAERAGIVPHGFFGWRIAVITANGFCDVMGVVTDRNVRHMAAPWSILVCSVQLLLSR
jgi:hypothetical protein